MKKIIIDTNFLMIPYQFRVDIFSEFRRICSFNYQLFIFGQTINELKKIIDEQTGKNKKAAQFALKLVKLKNINIIKSEQTDVDTLILSNLNEEIIPATQDIMLKRELAKRGASIIILRQKKYLQLIETKLLRF
ncbi:MAG: PIN domain-containing protein [Nanoarchaeota archaeon]